MAIEYCKNYMSGENLLQELVFIGFYWSWPGEKIEYLSENMLPYTHLCIFVFLYFVFVYFCICVSASHNI